MRSFVTYGLVVAFALVAQSASADVKSGPQVGESVGAFTVEKIAGNANDDVKDGQKLCYRCKMGPRPVVAVFARHNDAALADLVKKLDVIAAANSDKKFVAYVNLIGDDVDALKKSAKSLIETTGVKNIAVVVPKEHATGPKNYNLNPKADITVLIYTKTKVVVNHAISGKLSSDRIAQIVKDTGKILK